jgi:hypothetical protein
LGGSGEAQLSGRFPISDFAKSKAIANHLIQNDESVVDGCALRARDKVRVSFYSKQVRIRINST